MKKMPTMLLITGVTAGLLGAYALHLNYPDASPIQANNRDLQQQVATSVVPHPISQNTQPTLQANSPQTQPPVEITSAANDIDYPAMNPEYPTLDYRLEEMKARRDGQDFDADKVKAALRMASPWHEDASVVANLPVDAADQDDGRAFIKFEPMKIESLMPGDELVLPVPQENQSFKMVVDTVEAYSDGVVTWRGHLKDFPEQNQVSISQALGYTQQATGITQMGIFTPTAHYQVEVFGTQGWVVNSGKLFKRGLNGEDDVVIPDAKS
jgi:hypothetical protein